MHHNLQLEMEKLRVAPFFIPTAKYVVCASNTHIIYFLYTVIQLCLSVREYSIVFLFPFAIQINVRFITGS